MIAENEKSVRYQLVEKTVQLPETIGEFNIKKRQLVNEISQKRIMLLKELDVLWVVEQVKEIYEESRQNGNLSTSLKSLSLLTDKLRLFERAEASKLQTKSENWTAQNIEDVQMDLVRFCVESGNVQLAARVLETMKKGRDKTSIEHNYEHTLQQLIQEKDKSKEKQ
jgi:hypothetical protein